MRECEKEVGGGCLVVVEIGEGGEVEEKVKGCLLVGLFVAGGEGRGGVRKKEGRGQPPHGWGEIDLEGEGERGCGRWRWREWNGAGGAVSWAEPFLPPSPAGWVMITQLLHYGFITAMFRVAQEEHRARLLEMRRNEERRAERREGTQLEAERAKVERAVARKKARYPRSV